MNRFGKHVCLIAILLPCIALVGWGRYTSPVIPSVTEPPPPAASPGHAALKEAPASEPAQEPEPAADKLQAEISKLRQDLELAVDLLEKSFGKPVRLENIRSTQVTMTAYSSTADQCDSTPHITASNQAVRHGVVAVSDDLINEGLEFGQRILIPGHGVFEVQDRMNSRWSRRVDIWQSDREAARLFGKQEGTMLWLADL